MFYLDTSFIVSLITREPRTADAHGWLSRHLPEELAVSPWVTTEVSSALSMKLRTRQLDLTARTAAAGAYASLLSQSLRTLPISASAFLQAARYADRHDLALKGPDALHLAIAAEYGADLVTMDQPFARAATALGISTHLV